MSSWNPYYTMPTAVERVQEAFHPVRGHAPTLNPAQDCALRALYKRPTLAAVDRVEAAFPLAESPGNPWDRGFSTECEQALRELLETAALAAHEARCGHTGPSLIWGAK